MLVDIYENCTVLFADIAGFTKYSGSVEPAQVVGMLRELFEEFDKSSLSVIFFVIEAQCLQTLYYWRLLCCHRSQ